MSSHWEWAEERVRQHDAQRPFAPENGQPLRFAVGDAVIYTNEDGLEFRLHVTGYYERPQTACAMYANGARYLLDWSSPWFPAREECLRHDDTDLREAVACDLDTATGVWG